MQETLVDYRETYSFQPVDSFSASRLSDAPTLEQVLQVAERLRAAEPQYRYLCTLDDVNQSCYTRGHALEDERLTFDYDYDDLDLDDPESVRAYESRRLAHVVAQLQDPQLQQAWESLPGTLYVNAGDIAALAAMNRDPRRVLDQVVYVQRVPVPEDNLLIAGMVNGYFSADWDVFQNHAIIRRLEERHGYRFFGIGAAWLGFIRPQAPGADEARRLVADRPSCTTSRTTNRARPRRPGANWPRPCRPARCCCWAMPRISRRSWNSDADGKEAGRPASAWIPWRAARTVQRRRQAHAL